jgi:hypothetical protein
MNLLDFKYAFFQGFPNNYLSSLNPWLGSGAFGFFNRQLL